MRSLRDERTGVKDRGNGAGRPRSLAPSRRRNGHDPTGEPRPARRRSWAILLAWLLVVASLAFLGRGIDQRLSPMTLNVPNTPSARELQAVQQRFGNTVPVAVLLRGPSHDVRLQGRALVNRLRAIPSTLVMSPFDRSADAYRNTRSLRPKRGTGFILINYVRPAKDAMSVVPSTQNAIDATIHGPVRSYMTGVAVIGYALQQETLQDTEHAEMIALPILILVLLLVFRSPIAAAVPLVMGGATVAAGRGLLWLATFFTPINSLGVAVAAMMSLALGVDYALLMVSRVRQEVRGGLSHPAAIEVARRHAGRTIIAAGGTLALTMLAANAVATRGLLGPVAVGVIISGLLSVALAVSAMPVILRLLGPRLDRWEIHLWRTPRGGAYALAERLIAHPAIVVPLILAGMLVLAAPAGALRMGPPDPSELPASSPARQAVDMVQRTIGPGWSAPFVIVATARHGAITTPKRINAIIDWQQHVSHLHSVAAVLGPGSVVGARQKLAQAATAMRTAPRKLDKAQHGIDRLRTGLRSASAGVSELRNGLASAANGAGALGAGAGAAQNGVQKLVGGTDAARSGARRLAGATDQASAGASQLIQGNAQAGDGARQLAAQTGQAGNAATQLHGGLAQAADGSAKLAAGLDQAAAGADQLATSDHQLTVGAAQLAASIDTIDNTVHAALAPIQLLASQFQQWLAWMNNMQGSAQSLAAQLQQARSDLQSLSSSDNNPQVQAVSNDIDSILSQIDGGRLSQMTSFGQELSDALNRLAALPDQLDQLVSGLDRMRSGADQLATGTAQSEQGARNLSNGLATLSVKGHTLNGGLVSLSGGAGQLTGGLRRLSAGGGQLAGGLERVSAADRRLASGLGRLAAGNRRLAGGLDSLALGEGHLSGGLSQLQRGGERLAGALNDAHGRSGALAAGLASAQRPLQQYATMLAAYNRDYHNLISASPRAPDSGYLVLTALDGTVGPLRDQVAQLVNVNGGGQAARIMVVANTPPNSPATVALSQRLRSTLPELARAAGANVQIGEGAQYLLDYRNANSARFPWLVLALAVVAALTLVMVLRAIPLALLAVVLNLATIAVALGALELLTEAHVLGGPGYIDAASGAGILAIMFVLSIDYEVFLLTRMRESWLEHGDARAAVGHGVRHTAGVITGSAVIMTAVFMAFSGAAVVPLRQFGTGLTVAVLLDATIVRLVLLPAIMRVAGPRVWWMPHWLERRLPVLG